MIGKLIDVTNFNRQEAVEFIRMRCTDCNIYYFCNGADAKICNDKVDYLLEKFRRNSKGEFIMDFGTAIDAMKDKRKVARKGWNGKGMFLYYVPAGAYAPCTDIAKSIVNEDGLVEYGAYIAMKTAQGNVVPWLASQTDMLAEDWMIVE